MGFYVWDRVKVWFVDEWLAAPSVHLLYRQNMNEEGSRNMSTFIHKMSLCPFFQLSCLRESEFIPCTMCTYAPSAGLLIANQKLCFHSDCLSPLWKVFPVVAKTTIQQWQMNVAHSWVTRWAGDLSINKLSTQTGSRWRTGGTTVRGVERKGKKIMCAHLSVVLIH